MVIKDFGVIFLTRVKTRLKISLVIIVAEIYRNLRSGKFSLPEELVEFLKLVAVGMVVDLNSKFGE